MRRRPSKSGTPLNEKQRELAQRESDLRNQMKELERVIAEAPRVAAEQTRRQREELISRAQVDHERLNSFTVRDKRFSDSLGFHGPRVSLRKERREGLIIFLLLAIVLAGLVVWLMMHLPF